jgi:hypothetical protein
MTYMNNLIAQAKLHPTELVVEKRRVKEIAYHAKQMMLDDSIPLDRIIRMITRGECRLLNIPIRVKGVDHES